MDAVQVSFDAPVRCFECPTLKRAPERIRRQVENVCCVREAEPHRTLTRHGREPTVPPVERAAMDEPGVGGCESGSWACVGQRLDGLANNRRSRRTFLCNGALPPDLRPRLARTAFPITYRCALCDVSANA
jgi:hypothetical protein